MNDSLPPRPESFDIMFYQFTFKISPIGHNQDGRWHWVSTPVDYTGTVQLDQNTRHKVAEIYHQYVKDALKLYNNAESPYADLPLAEFLGRVLPD